MAHNIIMPKAGMAMEEGTVVRWLKKAGDTISKGEAIAVIETDKVTMDLESDYEGTLLAIVHGDGEVVKATDTIAWIGAPGEKVPTAAEAAPLTAVSRPQSVAPEAPAAASARSPGGRRGRSQRLPPRAHLPPSQASLSPPSRGPAPAARCA